jgi:hypothetical protein
MRMSSAKRIELGEQACNQYESAGLHWHKNINFVKDMLVRLRHGRSMSKKQREWYDNIVTSPLPTAKNQDIFDALVAAAAVEGVSDHKRKTMLDLASSAFLYNLSDKQVNFINSLLDYANEIKVNGPWEPTPEEIERCKIAIRLHTCRNAWWWSQNAGVARARDVVWYYLLHGENGEAFKQSMRASPAFPPFQMPASLEPWHVKILLKSFKTRIDGYLDPKWKVGDTGWYWDQVQAEFQFVTVLDAPEIGAYGELSYLCFVDGVPQQVLESRIKKTRRK